MRRPRKAVPPNTVTGRPFVATMIQIASYVGASHCLWSRNPSGRSSNRSILLAPLFLVRMHPEVRRNLPLDHDGPSGAKTHFVSFGTPHNNPDAQISHAHLRDEAFGG